MPRRWLPLLGAFLVALPVAYFGYIARDFRLLSRALWLGVFVLALGVALAARAAGRSGWWIYLAASFVPFLNAAAAVAWLSHLHQHPLRLGKADVEL